jgi:hypothetical protein
MPDTEPGRSQGVQAAAGPAPWDLAAADLAHQLGQVCRSVDAWYVWRLVDDSSDSPHR